MVDMSVLGAGYSARLYDFIIVNVHTMYQRRLNTDSIIPIIRNMTLAGPHFIPFGGRGIVLSNP